MCGSILSPTFDPRQNKIVAPIPNEQTRTYTDVHAPHALHIMLYRHAGTDEK